MGRDAAILGMHRYAVVGISRSRIVGDVAFTHGRRQGREALTSAWPEAGVLNVTRGGLYPFGQKTHAASYS